MRNQTGNISSWDKFFEQATENVSTYSWVVDLWKDPPAEYTLDYLFLLLLVNRNRSRYAVRYLASNVPQELDSYRDQLIKLFEKTEERLVDVLDQQSADNIQNTLNNPFPHRSRVLSTLLEDIQFTVHDNFLFESGDDDELREQCHDFLLRWQDLALCIKELAEVPWKEQFDYRDFAGSFSQTEKQFQKLFDCFYPVKDVLRNISAEESYGAEFWWLQRVPDKNEIESPAFTEKELSSVKNIFAAQESALCVDPAIAQQTISYALGELKAEFIPDARNHIITCKECFSLYLETRNSERLAGEVPMEHVAPISPITETDITSHATIPAPDSLLSVLQTKIKEILKGVGVVRPPQYAMAFTVACFCVVSLFYISSNRLDDTQPVPMTSLMANLQVYSTRLVETRGDEEILEKIQLKQNDVLKSGDSFFIEFTLSQDKYVYVLSVDSNGQVAEIYSGVVTANEQIHLPQQGGVYTLDSNTGSEFVYLLTTEKAIENFPEILPRLTNQNKTGIEQMLHDVQVYSFRFLHE